MRKIIGESFWTLILGILTGFLGYLIMTEKYLAYVHPRFKYHLIFSLIIMVIFLGLQGYKLYKKKIYIQINPSFVFIIIPMILLLLPNDSSALSSTFKNRGVKVSEFEDVLPESGNTPNSNNFDLKTEPHKKVSIDEYLQSENYMDLTPPEGRSFKNAIFTLTDDLKGSIGGHLTLDGFVYKDESLGENQFILARLLITCCTADAQLVGFVCEYKDADKLEQDTWVSVNVTISTTKRIHPLDGEEKEVAKLIVEDLAVVERPKNPYIYP